MFLASKVLGHHSSLLWYLKLRKSLLILILIVIADYVYVASKTFSYRSDKISSLTYNNKFRLSLGTGHVRFCNLYLILFLCLICVDLKIDINLVQSGCNHLLQTHQTLLKRPFILYLVVPILWLEHLARCVNAVMKCSCSGSNNTGAVAHRMVAVEEVESYFYLFSQFSSLSINTLCISAKYKHYCVKLHLILSRTMIRKQLHVHVIIDITLCTIYILTCYIMTRVLSFCHMAFSFDSNR